MIELPQFIQDHFLLKEEYGVFTIIYSVVLLLILVTYIFYTLWRLEKKRVNQDALNAAAYDKAMVILQEANKKSYDIIQNANDAAKKILTDSHALDDNSRKTLEAAVSKVSHDNIGQLNQLAAELLETYKKVIDLEKSKSLETVQSMSDAIKSEVLSEISEFKDELKKETVETENLVKRKVEEEYATIEKSLSLYKEDKYAAINKSIYEIIVQVSKDVLGKSLSLQDHEDLIVRSLENAKKVQEFKS